MVFNTLYKTNANWGKGRQPKNHFAIDGSLVSLCGRKQVAWMGGQIEYKDGKWYAEEVEISEGQIKKDTCAYCYASAFVNYRKQLNHG